MGRQRVRPAVSCDAEANRSTWPLYSEGLPQEAPGAGIVTPLHSGYPEGTTVDGVSGPARAEAKQPERGCAGPQTPPRPHPLLTHRHYRGLVQGSHLVPG